MSLRVEVDGQTYLLSLRSNGEYIASGELVPQDCRGQASIEEVMPGVFSVLVGTRSFTVHVADCQPEGLEVWAGSTRHIMLVADERDRPTGGQKGSARGPVELRAQMPGKIIKVLVALDAAVTAGQGLIVVEAMKMQNELKAPKDGKVKEIHVAEGATVAAGEPLIAVE